jgi:Protein of unknown function (DUF3455)
MYENTKKYGGSMKNVFHLFGFAAVCLASCAPNTTATSRSSAPSELSVPDGHQVGLTALSQGVQIYVCQTNATGFTWVFKAPQAVLLDNTKTKIGTHYAGPTWEGLDGSKVVGEVKTRFASPTPTAIPWLLLSAKSNEGTGSFGRTRFIQRLETTGGVAPKDGCDVNTVGKEVNVDYTALYVFFDPIK